MQIRSGYASSKLTGRDANVIVGSPEANWENVTPGALFIFAADNVAYHVGSTVDPETSESGEWEIHLTEPYAGAQKIAAAYAVHMDFEPFASLPLLRPGDVETAALFSRAMRIIGELLTEGLKFEGAWVEPVVDWPVDTTGNMSAYTMRRSYWSINHTADEPNYPLGGKIVWNGGTAGTAADWTVMFPSAPYIPNSFIVEAMIAAAAVAYSKLSAPVQDMLDVGARQHYQGEFDPGDGHPSTSGLLDKDYFVASAAGTVSGTDYLRGDWARFHANTGLFERERQYSPSTPHFNYQGVWNASGNSAPPDPNEYDAWSISVGGTFGGHTWYVGDVAVYQNDAWAKYPVGAGTAFLLLAVADPRTFVSAVGPVFGSATDGTLWYKTPNSVGTAGWMKVTLTA